MIVAIFVAFRITVDYFVAAQDVNLQPTSVSPFENDKVTFNCTITPQNNWRSTRFDVSFYIDSIVTFINNSGNCFETGIKNFTLFNGKCGKRPGVFLLEILNLNEQHDNQYVTCTARYGDGGTGDNIIQRQSNITVLVPISRVYINPVTSAIHNGSDQTFICTTDAGRPNARIQWYLSDGKNITYLASQHPECGSTSDKIESTSTLNLTGNLVDHGKAIYCIASNIDGRNVSSQKVIITILYGPNSVVLIPSTTSYTVTETTGSVGPIICTADCRPNCTITWSGPNLPDGTTSVLNVRNINRNQTGDYRCIAINDVGRFLSGKVRVRVYYVPSILRIEGNTTYTVNGTAEFRCDVDSVPKSLVKWIFVDANNTLILPYINTTIYKVNGNNLIVYPLNCLSMGLYICEASNDVGMTQKGINVTVLCSPKLNILEYDIVDMVAIAENEPLQLNVPVLAYPKPTLYWQFKKDHHISNITNGVTNRHYVKRHMSSLIIYDMKEENFGVYTIYGSNTLDVNSRIQSYHVVASRRPQSPRYVVALCKSSLLTITWWAGFKGGDNQIFTVEVTNNRTGEKISTDNITDPENGKYLHYSINVLTVDSQFVVVLKSSNIYGESNSTTKVKCNSSGSPLSKSTHSPSLTLPVGIVAGIGISVVIVLIATLIIGLIRKFRKKPPAPSKVYEETKSDFGSANIYNDLNESTNDDPNKGNSTRVETDTPCVYDEVLTPKKEVNKKARKGRNPPKTGSAIYMNTEI